MAHISYWNRNFPYFHYERLKDGSHWYIRDTNTNIEEVRKGLEVSLNNPVLQPAINLIARLFSSAIFAEVKEDGTVVENSDLVALLEDPNLYQSQQDFLEQFIWFKYSFGYLYVYPVHPVGVKSAERTTLNNLRTSYIKYEEDFNTKILFKKSEVKDTLQQKFKYDDEENDQKLEIEVGKIIPFYDLANGIGSSNLLTGPSRLTSIKTEISNINQAGCAKNKAIQTNGRELYSNKNSGVGTTTPLSKKEKEEIQDRLNKQTGLGSNRSRAVVTSASMEWQSLHIKLAELGLDDSRKADANTIIAALGIPLDLFDKTSTYENKEQAMLGFMQNNIIPQMNDFTNSLTSYFQLENSKLIGTYDHLPIMATIKEMELSTTKKKAETLEMLLRSGVTPDDALMILEWNEINIIPIINN